MFVRNSTKQPVTLAKGRVLDDLAVGAVVHRAVFRVAPGRLIPWEGPRPALPDDPPPTDDRPLWHGTSVTVAGHVRGPGRVARPASLDIQVADRKHSVLVWGDRQWVRNGGKLIASTPALWDTKALSWSIAFGGGYDVPPGPHPQTKLPHPGGRVLHPMNPLGMGLYRDEPSAEGKPLPSIERPEQSIVAWNDSPRPAGVSPCPELVGLRAPAERVSLDEPDKALRLALRMAHHAPGELIFDWLPEGTPLRIEGTGREPVELQLPAPLLLVKQHRVKSCEDTRSRVRSVHVSLDDAAVLIEYGYSFLYEPARAPAWLTVEERA